MVRPGYTGGCCKSGGDCAFESLTQAMRDALTSGACFNAGGLWKPDVESGTYDINRNGGSTIFKVHCDFDSPEGPWTVIMDDG